MSPVMKKHNKKKHNKKKALLIEKAMVEAQETMLKETAAAPKAMVEAQEAKLKETAAAPKAMVEAQETAAQETKLKETVAAHKAMVEAQETKFKEEKDEQMLFSVVNDALKSLSDAEKRGKNQAEKRGKNQATISPSHQVITRFLTVMKKRNYIEEFKDVDDLMCGKIAVVLNGRVNECGVISPRVDVGVDGIDDFVANLLPTSEFGYVVLATSAGFMDHKEAKRENLGGKVLGFFY